MLMTRPFAYNESLQHLTIAVLLMKIVIIFFDYSLLSSLHLFQSNQHFQAIEFVAGTFRKSSEFYLS